MLPPALASDASRSPRGVLCVGEALVDLICERHVTSLAEAPAFVPHPGGVAANIAAAAAAAGAPAALAGSAGQDAWGAWLVARLAASGVDTTAFSLLEDTRTAVAFVTVDPAGEPAYHLAGTPGPGLAACAAEPLGAALERSAALMLSSNTLSEPAEREVTMRLREQALELGRPVIFDVNLRLHRWRSRADAAASANACVAGALLVRANQQEAALLTGEEDPERAARALVKTGARAVVISAGSRGAILRGELRRDAAAPALEPGEILSTMGAGDVLTGILLARLALSGFYLPAVAAALPEAVAASAAACRRWSVLD